jgi:hypothetical protein
MTDADGKRESWLGVFGIATGLAVAAIAFALPFLLPARTLDARAILDEEFALAPLPFGLEPREAYDLPFGERVVLLAGPESSTDAARAEIAESAPAASPAPAASNAPDGSPTSTAPAPPAAPADGAPPLPDFFDWSTLPDGPKDQPPAHVAVVWYPRAQAESLMRSLFWNAGGAPGEMMMMMVGPAGGTVSLERGEIPWGDYGAAYARQRRYVLSNEAGTERRFFRETMRVNLSRAGVPCVLHATWAEGLPASKARVEELLESLLPKP